MDIKSYNSFIDTLQYNGDAEKPRANLKFRPLSPDESSELKRRAFEDYINLTGCLISYDDNPGIVTGIIVCSMDTYDYYDYFYSLSSSSGYTGQYPLFANNDDRQRCLKNKLEEDGRTLVLIAWCDQPFDIGSRLYDNPDILFKYEHISVDSIREILNFPDVDVDFIDLKDTNND